MTLLIVLVMRLCHFAGGFGEHPSILASLHAHTIRLFFFFFLIILIFLSY